MTLQDIQIRPTNRVLRQFSAAWLVFIMAMAFKLWRGHHDVAIGMGVAAVVVGVLGLLVPPAVRWVYVSCMVIAFPIGWVVSHVVLALLFYGMMTPLAWFLRWRGRDLLGRRPPSGRASFWTAKTTPEDVSSYFRQY